MTAEELIEFYNLLPHPEGGFFKETYRASETIKQNGLPGRFAGERSFSTGIFFLLQKDDFSAFHKIKSDEMWHFYAGDTLNIFVIHVHGELQMIKLGSDIRNGAVFQAVVPAECWFASEPANKNSFSFVGCTVAPGFDFADFELAEKAKLSEDFPQHYEIIHRLSRI